MYLKDGKRRRESLHPPARTQQRSVRHFVDSKAFDTICIPTGTS
jgi:hypothetical protein